MFGSLTLLRMLIEERVLALQRRKAALFDTVIDDGEAFAASLDAADIRGLLGP